MLLLVDRIEIDFTQQEAAMSEERLQALEARVEALAKAWSANADATVQIAAATTQTAASAVAMAQNMRALTSIIDGARQTHLTMAASTVFLLEEAGVIQTSAFLTLIDLAISSAKDATYASFLRHLRDVLAAGEPTQAAPKLTVVEGGLAEPID